MAAPVEEPATDPRDQWWVAPPDRDDDAQEPDVGGQDGAWEPDTEPVVVHRQPVTPPEPAEETPSEPTSEPTSEAAPEPVPEPERNTEPAPEPAAVPSDNGHSEASTVALHEVAREPRHASEPATSSEAAKDRLLRVLLSDPETALVAVGDLTECREQLDRLTESVGHQRGELAKVARRLRSAGLTSAQVAQLAGFGEGELATLLAEHAPSPRPRVR